MKSLQQQLKPISPLYKRASLLLFIFLMLPNLNAQNFYYKEGTKITILENTTLYVTDSGEVNQESIRDFEGKITVKKEALNQNKNIVFNEKKSKVICKKEKKEIISKASEEVKIEHKTEPIEFVKTCPDNFFSNYQKGIAISTSVNIQYHLKFIIENIKFKSIQKYFIESNNTTTNNDFLFLKDYHLSRYTTRPPPLKFYI